MTGRDAYQQLEARFRRIGLVGEALGMLSWDRATMMPAASAEARAQQITELQLIAHEALTDPELGEWLELAESAAEGELDAWQRANLREMQRRRRHSDAVAPDLVAAHSSAASACEMVWREARAADDFAAVRPRLEDVLARSREVGAAKAEAFGTGAYDALLDEYEPEGSSERIDRHFSTLADFLPGFLEQVLERQAREPAPVVPEGPFPVDRQRALGEELMRILGFPFEQGRLDVSHHPFSGGTPDDLRITTRYDEADFTSSLMAVLHETGHAMYEHGLPAAWRRQPVGEARSMSLHESQSLLIEMQVCRGVDFIQFAAPHVREAFGADGPRYDAANLTRIYHRVARSTIRVDADEVTYPAHVILRYRLEQALVEGRLEVADLPGAWREGMRELVGIEPPDDRDGCMQDIHWYAGLFGYFPTYTLGAMTAAQLFAAARRGVPGLDEAIGRGDFGPLFGWLRANVHEKASQLPTDALLCEATGDPLSTQPYIAHLRARYLPD